MVARVSCCLRELSEGDRSLEVRFGRFLGNDRVTIDDLIEGWSERTASAAAGRHVLAIQDTSEINFPTTADHRRGLGEIGKGVGRGVLVHAMVAVDADSGACLGLVGGATRWLVERGVSDHMRRHPDTVFDAPVLTPAGWTAIGRRPVGMSPALA
jgi:hypothetical protein